MPQRRIARGPGWTAIHPYPEDCTACRLCEERCTFDAITVKPGAVKKSSEIFAFRQYLIGLGLQTNTNTD
ncbi:MAG: 4Fe-4S binding protein [Chloroflexi bacterium]|nr:4Fe-4S binding protein [Chloroflexota bacterium]